MDSFVQRKGSQKVEHVRIENSLAARVHRVPGLIDHDFAASINRDLWGAVLVPKGKLQSRDCPQGTADRLHGSPWDLTATWVLLGLPQPVDGA
jgi:hypothetical protein